MTCQEYRKFLASFFLRRGQRGPLHFAPYGGFSLNSHINTRAKLLTPSNGGQKCPKGIAYLTLLLFPEQCVHKLTGSRS